MHCDHNGNKTVFIVKKVVTINIFASFFKLEFFETKVKQMKQKWNICFKNSRVLGFCICYWYAAKNDKKMVQWFTRRKLQLSVPYCNFLYLLKEKKTNFSKSIFHFPFLDIYKCPILRYGKKSWKNVTEKIIYIIMVTKQFLVRKKLLR